MAKVSMPSHSIFNHPGDEGSAPSYDSADKGVQAAPMTAFSHDPMQRPGDEGSAGLGSPDMSPEMNVQGYQNVPPDSVKGFAGGEEVRATYVPPTKADSAPGMPGAK